MEASEKPRSRRGNEKRQRTALVQIRCTPEEHACIIVAAERVGLSVGAYVRMQCIGKPGPRAIRRPTVEAMVVAQLVAHLGKVGSNLNQIARVVNSGGNVPPDLSSVIGVANRNHRGLGSQSSAGRARDHCTGSDVSGPQSLHLCA
jgi:hypothetical protein